MRTETTQFEASHGRKPRGFGNWFFEVVGTDGNGSFLTVTVEASGRFTEAKSRAVREFKRDCGQVETVVSVEVLP